MSVRCNSIHRQWRCCGNEDHAGPHWADTGRNDGGVLRWGLVAYGCHDTLCIREPGHPEPHRDGRGTSWWVTEETANPEDALR